MAIQVNVGGINEVPEIMREFVTENNGVFSYDEEKAFQALKNERESAKNARNERAEEDAIGKYVEMFEKYGSQHHYRMWSRLMQDDDGYSMHRVRPDDMERSGRLPTVEVDELNYRGRSRDSMGRFK